MPIEWREGLSVGHPVIDKDHQELIAIINDFERSVETEGGKESLSAILRRLHDYAVEHFKREQRLQERVGFPFATSHAAEHWQMLEMIREKGKAWFVDKSEPVSGEAADWMAGFLRHWLLEHIVKHDLAMRRYIEKARGRKAGG